MRIIILTLIFMVSMHNAVSLDNEITQVDFDDRTIFVGGSTSVSGLFLQVKENFEARSKYQFQLRQLGSDKGILAVHNGIIDIGFSSRYLTTEEQKKYPNLKQYIIAHDAIALFVNKNNPINALQRKDVSSYYSGEIKFWPSEDPSVAQDKITLMTKDVGHGTLDTFSDFFQLDYMSSRISRGLNFKYRESLNLYRYKTIATTYNTAAQAVAFVNRVDTAIAFDSLSYVLKELKDKKISNVKLISIDGQPAMVNGVINPNYPIYRPLIMLVNGNNPKKGVANFMDFLKTEEVKELIEKSYYLTVN